MSKLDWALQHAANGRRVFPIARGTKHPLVEWGAAATDDPDQIRAWWTQWPNADIAGATGRGWLVLDVDTKKGHDGERSLRELESRVGSLDTYTVRTRSGGLHLYFNVDGITKNSEGVLGDGLDTRGDGGFVMLPGSDGYQVIDELPAVTVPDALLEELRRRAPTRQEVLKTAPLDVAEGRRAAYLLSLVSQLREAGADDDLCTAQVERANSELRNPMTRDELQSNVLGSLKRWVRGTVLVKTPPPPLSDAIRLDTVTEKRVKWLWHGRIPLGKLTMLDGAPGVGKSYLTLDIAARVSTGRPMADGGKMVEPRGVLLLAVEDDADDTIVPRLRMAGADLSRISLIPQVFDVTSPDGIERIKREVELLNAQVVIFDPLLTFLGSDKTDTHRDRDVRRSLDPLTAYARERHVALIGIRHLRKGGDRASSALDMGMGSTGIGAVARSVMIAAHHTDDDAGNNVLAVAKVNLAAKPPSLQYRLKSTEDMDHAAIEWTGESKYEADELVAPAEKLTRSDEVEDYVAKLREGGKLVKAADVVEFCRANGYSKATMDKVRARMGLKSVKQGDGWYWV